MSGASVAWANEPAEAPAQRVYLFTSFDEPATAGLRLLYSLDGLDWQRIPGVFLKPLVGQGGLMRDPSLARGPDGWFHLVWTTAWRGDAGFGHARSRDLVHWSPQKFVPVMQHEPGTVNVWAPELFYDSAEQQFVICWASTIPGRYPDGEEASDNNHRMYATTTADFETFSPAQLFCEPGFSVIDAVVVPFESEYRLVLKDNTRPVRALRVARGDSPLGPWEGVGEPFTAHLTEGPTVAKIGDEWLIYYDAYGDKKYGVVATKDFKSFRDLSESASFPAGHKHGTVVEITRPELDYLIRVGSEQRPGIGAEFTPQAPADLAGKRLAEIDATIAQGPFQPSWESLGDFRVPEWYQDAKFGLFIHWGPYATPAFGSEWYPRNMYVEGSKEYEHHRKTYGPQSEFGYKDFIPRFKAERFDPAGWAALFKQSGARYVIPVAEHHDGFAMYDSDYTQWSAAKQGPRRDVLAELAAAIRREGIEFGASSHRAENWWFFGPGKLFDSDVRAGSAPGLYGPAHDKRVSENQSEQPDQAFLDDWLLRTCEIVDKHRPSVVYFDWWICQPVFQPYLKRFAAYYYNRGVEWGRPVAINFKEWEGYSFPRGTGVLDVERGKFSEPQPELWQTCTSVSKNSWGYIADHQYKEAGAIVDDLIDIVSKNGVMLLNIGPKADGTIPDAEQQMLRTIGAWLAVNGEAIYGTRPWTTYGEGPTEAASGSFTDAATPEFTGQDFRFTQKGDKLYAIVLRWPEEGKLVVRSMKQGTVEIRDVALLGCNDALAWRQTVQGLEVTLPGDPPTPFAHALRVTREEP